MGRQIISNGRLPNRIHHTNSLALAKRAKQGVPFNKRARIVERSERLPFMPPENWYEPTENIGRIRFVQQPAGNGYRHVLTPEDVRARLAQLPAQFTAGLEVVQFSRMTRKKQSFPCYGMQWGSTVYLYPIEESLVEQHVQAPKPQIYHEARMFGGEWVQEGDRGWKLIWTESAIRDFYLNNILIHELGHVVDNRNTSYQDRERFAEWFALEYGYKPSRESRPNRAAVSRRHHKCGR